MSSSSQNDTVAGRQASWFVTTHWSVVLASRRAESREAEAALEKLCQAYWYPLYAFVRRQGHGPHEAQDLTQEFFATLLAKNFLDSVDQEKGKFRSFLLAAISHFLANQRDRANAVKRGGGKAIISLDEIAAEERYSFEPASGSTPEQEFEKRWAVTLLDQAFAAIRREYEEAGKSRIFEELKTFLADETGSGDYAEPGMKLGMNPNTVAVTVRRMRQRYRELVYAEVANTVSSGEEIEQEMNHLLAVLSR